MIRSPHEPLVKTAHTPIYEAVGKSVALMPVAPVRLPNMPPISQKPKNAARPVYANPFYFEPTKLDFASATPRGIPCSPSNRRTFSRGLIWFSITTAETGFP
jgi:hypothetical protein